MNIFCNTQKTIIQARVIVFLFYTAFSCYSVSAQPLPKVCAGNIIRHYFTSKLVLARNIDVWLPPNYNAQHTYTVLYMHDGQMLFDSTTTWNNKEWGVDECFSQLIKQQKVKECIVVGIWNAGTNRHSDYMPQKPFEALSAQEQDSVYAAVRSNGNKVFSSPINSDAYLRFIVQELKPFIDSAYATKRDQPNTLMAGASMGGLISMYAICEYPEVFGGVACLSTHWPGIFKTTGNPFPKAFAAYLATHLPKPKNHQLYFDYGTATLDAMYEPYQLEIDAIIKAKHYTKKKHKTLKFIGDAHSEVAWSRRLHVPITFLLGR